MAAAFLSGDARADLLFTKKGGIMDGEILKESETSVKIKTRLGTTDISRSDIKSIERGKSILDLYRQKWIETNHDNVKDRIGLAVWAKRYGLDEEAEKEFRDILRTDPNNSSARRYLNYVKFAGKWMLADEAHQARGDVKYRGKWMTPQERDLLISNKQRMSTSRKVDEIFRKMRKSKMFERDALLQILFELKTPQAAHFIRKHLRERDSDLRTRAVIALGRLKDKESVKKLAKMAMEDPDKDLRQQAGVALGLIRSLEALNLIVPLLVNGDKIVRIRSAKTLGNMGDPRAVPALIKALYIKIKTVSSTDPFRRGDGNNTPIAVTDNGRSVDLNNDTLVRTRTKTSTLGLLGNNKKDNLAYEINAAALTALKKITGQDFEYEKRKWIAWWDAHKDDLLEQEE